jgi:hypothetical protein
MLHFVEKLNASTFLKYHVKVAGPKVKVPFASPKASQDLFSS